MKTNVQTTDHAAVKKYLADHDGATIREAIKAVATTHKKNFGTVQASYYRVENKNKPKVAKAKRAATRKQVKQQPHTLNLDLNVLRSSLKDALSAIDMLERQNAANDKIVADLRKALSV